MKIGDCSAFLSNLDEQKFDDVVVDRGGNQLAVVPMMGGRRVSVIGNEENEKEMLSGAQHFRDNFLLAMRDAFGDQIAQLSFKALAGEEGKPLTARVVSAMIADATSRQGQSVARLQFNEPFQDAAMSMERATDSGGAGTVANDLSLMARAFRENDVAAVGNLFSDLAGRFSEELSRSGAMSGGGDDAETACEAFVQRELMKLSGSGIAQLHGGFASEAGQKLWKFITTQMPDGPFLPLYVQLVDQLNSLAQDSKARYSSAGPMREYNEQYNAHQRETGSVGSMTIELDRSREKFSKPLFPMSDTGREGKFDSFGRGSEFHAEDGHGVLFGSPLTTPEPVAEQADLAWKVSDKFQAAMAQALVGWEARGDHSFVNVPPGYEVSTAFRDAICGNTFALCNSDGVIVVAQGALTKLDNAAKKRRLSEICAWFAGSVLGVADVKAITMALPIVSDLVSKAFFDVDSLDSPFWPNEGRPVDPEEYDKVSAKFTFVGRSGDEVRMRFSFEGLGPRYGLDEMETVVQLESDSFVRYEFDFLFNVNTHGLTLANPMRYYSGLNVSRWPGSYPQPVADDLYDPQYAARDDLVAYANTKGTGALVEALDAIHRFNEDPQFETAVILFQKYADDPVLGISDATRSAIISALFTGTKTPEERARAALVQLTPELDKVAGFWRDRWLPDMPIDSGGMGNESVREGGRVVDSVDHTNASPTLDESRERDLVRDMWGSFVVAFEAFSFEQTEESGQKLKKAEKDFRQLDPKRRWEFFVEIFNQFKSQPTELSFRQLFYQVAYADDGRVLVDQRPPGDSDQASTRIIDALIDAVKRIDEDLFDMMEEEIINKAAVDLLPQFIADVKAGVMSIESDSSSDLDDEDSDPSGQN